MVIDGNDNKKREIKTGIRQGLPVSPIFFLKYISKVFDTVAENNQTVTSELLVDDVGFIGSDNSVKKIS